MKHTKHIRVYISKDDIAKGLESQQDAKQHASTSCAVYRALTRRGLPVQGVGAEEVVYLDGFVAPLSYEAALWIDSFDNHRPGDPIGLMPKPFRMRLEVPA